MKKKVIRYITDDLKFLLTILTKKILIMKLAKNNFDNDVFEATIYI